MFGSFQSIWRGIYKGQNKKLENVARFFFKKKERDPEKLAAWGLSPEDFANDEICEFFLENELVVKIFARICNQWRSSSNGLFALDYNILPMMFEIFSVPLEKRLQIIDDIGVMEITALDEIRKR